MSDQSLPLLPGEMLIKDSFGFWRLTDDSLSTRLTHESRRIENVLSGEELEDYIILEDFFPEKIRCDSHTGFIPTRDDGSNP